MPTPAVIKLYNTLTRKVEPLAPLEPGTVKIYCCGPTVYNYQHIGNLRTYIFEDLLTRTLRLAGYRVLHVMNITDVGHLVSDADSGEDKMLVAARREGKRSDEVAAFYTNVFFEHCDKLHIERPGTICKATAHIPEMLELIARLEARGFTYSAGGNVYFDISKFPDYGRLAQLNLEALEAGARIEVVPHKRNPHDFVLWFTKSKFEGQELQWDSPWGRGYPGWHIECSAMSIKYLGEQFDIHCGGIDHVPVHHTNEIAQSEAATGKKWVSVWMHGEFLLTEKEKMSKSKGGFLTLDVLEERGYDALAYRFFCFGAHYRTQLAFGMPALDSAANSLQRLKGAVLQLQQEAGETAERDSAPPDAHFVEQFAECLYHDLNLPQALACMWELISQHALKPQQKLATLYYFDQVLGLGMRAWQAEQVDIPSAVNALLQAREGARAQRNWQEADRLRKEIEGRGFLIEDLADGPRLKRKTK